MCEHCCMWVDFEIQSVWTLGGQNEKDFLWTWKKETQRTNTESCKFSSAVHFTDTVKMSSQNYPHLLFQQFLSVNVRSVTPSCFCISWKVQTLSGPASNINTPTLAHMHTLTNTPLALSLSNSHIWSLSTPAVCPPSSSWHTPLVLLCPVLLTLSSPRRYWIWSMRQLQQLNIQSLLLGVFIGSTRTQNELWKKKNVDCCCAAEEFWGVFV